MGFAALLFSKIDYLLDSEGETPYDSKAYELASSTSGLSLSPLKAASAGSNPAEVTN